MKTFGLVLMSVALLACACSEKKQQEKSVSEEPVTRHEAEPPAAKKGEAIAAAGPETATPPVEAHAKHPRVEFTTNHGKIVVELNPAKAPKSVANFLSYVKSGHYNGTIFHRVISGFMIQGGGFTADMKQKPTRAPVQNEADNGLKNTRGTLAMARTNVPHSATSQFFVNVVDNAF